MLEVINLSGIQVLSDSLKGGNKLEKSSAPKGKAVSDRPENAAEGFAAMLSGTMNLNADPKGQNSKVGKELEEKQSADKPMQSQNPNEQGSALGYVNFALLNLFQPMLPAGKEANSGNDVSQGTGVIATTNASLTNAPIVSGNNFGLALLDFASLISDEVFATTGMTTPKPQGANPAITELDKYRQVITNLLIALSGEITDPSLMGKGLGLNGPGAMDLRQEMAKIVQGWRMVTDEAAEETSGVVNGQKGIQPLLDALAAGIGSGDPALKEKVSTLLAALYPKLSQGNEGPEGMKLTIQGKDEMIDPAAKGGSEPFLKQLKGIDLKPVANQVIYAAQQKSEGMSTQKGDSMQSVETFGGKDVQSQNSSASIGALNNIITGNVADGKTVTIPVWAQISSVIREQVMNRSQDLKQLEIQLHPADLGKIQIGMRWENGQVHLVVQASEAATGQLLQNQLSDLRQNLTNQGVNCGMLEMGQNGERRQNSPGDESQRTFNQDTSQNAGEEQSSVSDFLSLGQDGINRINVTA